jgi:oligoendopeptidase F
MRLSVPQSHPSDVAAAEPPQVRSRLRQDIPDRFKWNLADIFPTWEAWEGGYKTLEEMIGRYAALKGTLSGGADRLLDAFRLSEEMGQLAYRVWYYPSLQYDEDQRDNLVNAKRQQVQILFARLGQAESWFNPELLSIPLAKVRGWMAASPALAVYRFVIENLYRQQEHVLDEAGEKLMSLASRVASAPNDAYWALSTADARFPKITLSTGEEVTVSYGQYRALLATRREQSDREAAFTALHETYNATLNTYATLYNGVCQRDWFQARARGYASTLDAALHGDNIPPSVVENLISTTRAGVEPLRRYHRLRRKALGVPSYHVYDFSIPLVTFDKKYQYDDVLDWIVAAVQPLGTEFQARMREGFAGRWIDVYENEGKRSGAYSAPVYGTHPYMLLNYNDTLDDVFTLAHEMGHSMHTILSHESQPFVYSSYTIFVAEVPSTLTEALLLEYMLEHSTDPAERIVLLQHAIDNITGTFFTQVMFADYELRAHRLAEQDQPITSEILTEMYSTLLKDYYGDAVDMNAFTGITWARIPHFFNSPYYVYQYATCFASAARLSREMMHAPTADDARARYLSLLRSGGNDYPMEQLKKAGVDLTQPDTVMAVIEQLDDLVTRLERELAL